VPASEITPATSAAPVADAAAADATDLPAAPAHAGKAPADGAAPQRASDQQATPQAGGQATAQSGQQQPDGQPPSQPAAAAHAEGQVAPAATDRPASAAPAPDAAAPVAQAESMATPQATSPAAPVRAEHVQGGLQLAQTVERLREMVQIATRNGAAHARLQLHPVELGAVEVRLKASTDGVTAKIIADRPEAVEALQQAGADLRRSLEDRGVTVLDVEISLSASAGDDPGAHNAAHAGSQNGLTSETTTNRRGRDAASEPTSETDELSESTRAPRADSGAVLVDVLA
jgi:flagellar hook-length control protein FliK